MAVIKSAMRGVIEPLHSAGVATANGIALAIPSSYIHHKIIIKTSAGVASGAVQPESADVADYTGTWNPIGGGPITVPAASSIYEYEFTGRFSAIRARISTIVVGGTVDISYVGSP